MFCMFLLISCGQKSAETEQEIRPVKYESVQSSARMETYAFSGEAKAQNETNLSFNVAGTLASVNVKLGDRVRKDQLIATVVVILTVDATTVSQINTTTTLNIGWFIVKCR